MERRLFSLSACLSIHPSVCLSSFFCPGLFPFPFSAGLTSSLHSSASLWLCLCVRLFLCLLPCLAPVSLLASRFFHLPLSCSSLSFSLCALPVSLWLLSLFPGCLSVPACVFPSPQPLGPCRCEPGFLGRACDLHLWENQGAGWWHNVSAGDPAFSARIGAAGAFLSPLGLLIH